MRKWLFVFFLTQLIFLSGGYLLYSAHAFERSSDEFSVGAGEYQDSSPEDVTIVQATPQGRGYESFKFAHHNITIEEEEDFASHEKESNTPVLLISIFCSLVLGSLADRYIKKLPYPSDFPVTLSGRKYLLYQVFRI